ncbi:aspartate kinase [Lutimonas zeaxanthinifaciens]|uniref:aspartate kinase n=1 Tax=Lutimonas zeaxanthinifaciens TaxID=3060215 RepID=UPI00265D52D2|nr:aspartate kinase [Lutimonas sp. YSD2104]WKK67216.1 aspartate kinase [Lutimonas sp. YSD2104]
MLVLKFGGTSVGSVENFRKVAEIVRNTRGDKIVVLSAMSGVTNTLVQITDLLEQGQSENALELINGLNQKYLDVARELLDSDEAYYKAQVVLKKHHQTLLTMTSEEFNSDQEKIVLAQGELVSTNLFQLYLEDIEEDSVLLSALDFMSIDKHGEPKTQVIRERLGKILSNYQSSIFITQGFICRNANLQIDNLKRGGSDYSASLIGAAVGAEQIQIWTDIDGMHNNDPRYVDSTFSVSEMSFAEAAELAYFGAKILHPQSIIPAQENNIPVLLLNTFKPDSKGTLIHNKASVRKIRAIAAKDNITAIKIKSYRMLMAYGFLKKVFEVFEAHKTSIDMITTSEVAVSLTIDNTEKLDVITNDLQGFGNIEVDTDLSIICIAGDIAQNKKGITSAIFEGLKDVPIRMISYGGSNYNLSFLVKTSDKIAVLNLLNESLFPELAAAHA